MFKRVSAVSRSRNFPWAAIVLAGSLVRILSYHFSTNTGGDAMARVLLTAMWLQHPSLQVIFGVYPPGHFWLIAAFTLLFRDVMVAGRALSLVLGIASLLLVGRLARLLYGETAGLLSLVAFSFYTLHIAYSTTSSSEVSYLFFLLLGMYFFFSSLSGGSPEVRLISLAGIAMSIAGSIRYEAWIFIFGMTGVLTFFLIRDTLKERQDFRKRLRSLLAFGVTGGLWPAFMMVYCWRRFGDPMYLVTLNHIRVTESLAAIPSPLSYQLGLTPAVLAISLSPFIFGAALYGLACSFTSRLPAAFATLTVFFAAVQNFEILRHGLLALSRYTLTLGTLLAIMSGIGLQQAFRKIGVVRPGLMRVATSGLLLANTVAVLALSELPDKYSETFASVSPVLRYPRRIQNVAGYLRAHLGPEDAVVVDNYNVESNIVAYAGGLPLLSGKRAYLANTKYDYNVRQYIATVHPQFMVYSDRGTLRQSFALPSSCDHDARLDGIGFHCVFSDDIYRIYELSYHR